MRRRPFWLYRSKRLFYKIRFYANLPASPVLIALGLGQVYRNKYLLQQGIPIPITDTANYRDQALAAFVALQEQCNALCQDVGINSDLRQKMLDDVTPPTVNTPTLII